MQPICTEEKLQKLAYSVITHEGSNKTHRFKQEGLPLEMTAFMLFSTIA